MWVHEYLALHPAVPRALTEVPFPRSRRWLAGEKSLYSDRLVEATRRDLDLLILAQVRFLQYFSFIVPPCCCDLSMFSCLS